MNNLKQATIRLFFVSLLCCSYFLPLAALAASSEAERTALVEGAKKEGKVVWYTAVTTAEADKLLKKFHEKYPFITPEVFRSGDEKLLIKAMGESQAKRYLFDAIMTTGTTMILMQRKGLFSKYLSPERKFYNAAGKDPEGYWTDLYLNLNVIGYNTKLVSPKDLPKKYEDLLLPRWKGKLGMDTKAFEWFAGVLKVMGEKKGLEYMKKLGEQNIQFRTGRTLNAQMVAAGEVDMSITIYNQRVEEMKAQGAPIDWVAIEPLVPGIHPLAISAHAPHPNAARLLVDFLLSKEGQELIASFYRIPSRTDVEPIVPTMRRGLKIMDSDFNFDLVDNHEKITKLYRQTLMKK